MTKEQLIQAIKDAAEIEHYSGVNDAVEALAEFIGDEDVTRACKDLLKLHT